MSAITRSGGGCAWDQRERHARATSPARDLDADNGNANGNGRARTRRPAPAVVERLALLPPRDRAIVDLTLRSNLTRSGIARALGMAPGAVSRRLRVLYVRLHDPLVVALCDEHCPLAAEYRQLGVEHYLLGVSAPQLADKHRMPVGEVRRVLAFLRGWQKGRMGKA